MKKLVILLLITILLGIFVETIAIYFITQNNKIQPLAAINSPNTLTYTPLDLEGKTVGKAKMLFYPGEGYASKFKNLEISLNYVDRIEIRPGETFSFNKVSRLLDKNVDSIYLPGYNVKNYLVSAGGVCSAAVLIASAARNAGLEFYDLEGKPALGPVPHLVEFPLYSRTIEIDGENVPLLDATVATEFDKDGNSYSLNDVLIKNNKPYTLILEVNWEWNQSDSDSSIDPYRKNTQQVSMTARLKSFQ